MTLFLSRSVARLTCLAFGFSASLTLLSACRSRSFNPPGVAGSGAKVVDEEPGADGEAAARNGYTFNVMAPLTLPSSEAEWASLDARLSRMKALGAYAVSTDVWWRLVEASGDDVFSWGPYERLAEAIVAAKLKWVPILSFHQCGGNVGDECDFKLPDWLWGKYPGAITRSEHGNETREATSVWATRDTVSEYVAFMGAFRDRFSRFAPHVAEINVSFGPAGELRYPSYNSHDGGKTGFPTRGGLQAHSEAATESFRRFVLKKHGSVASAASAWGIPLAKAEDILPPRSGDEFYSTGAHMTPYGRDFFAWYHGSLMERGRILGEAAIEAFLGKGSAFSGVELGAKVPGVHWRMGTDRAAELSAGLILPPTEGAAPSAKDYEGIAKLFAGLDARAQAKGGRFVLHFTCLEMGDDEGGADIASKASTLVRMVGEAAAKEGVLLKGENALSGTLGTQGAWDNMRRSVLSGPYKGLTILRFDDILGSEVARRNFSTLVRDASTPPKSSL